MNNKQTPRDPHHDNEAEPVWFSEVHPYTVGLIRTEAFTEAAHALDVWADQLTDSEDEYKAALVTRCADLVRDLIDHDDDGRGPNPSSVFTHSHGFAPPKQKDKP